MLVLDAVKIKLKNMRVMFDECVKTADIGSLSARKKELDILLAEPDLYKDTERAQKLNSQAKQISSSLEDLAQKEKQLSSLCELSEIIEENDDTTISELEADVNLLQAQIEALNLTTLLKGEYDKNNAIVSIHAGAGGTEAMDWTDMLYRMYRMYADKKKYAVEELFYLAGEEAGVKNVTFLVSGLNAYGFLKAEKGVHRLVRISPFDSNARRHTSFASVEVMPEIDSSADVKINPDDLKVDTYRSGGAGGQHVNKTESAIRITHIPTGIVVQCQNERSQIKNRDTAMKMLLSKLIERREREIEQKNSDIKGELKKIEWGSQIRSYVFQPYTMVKDLRTNYEDTDVNRVMNGNIDGFICEYLRKS